MDFCHSRKNRKLEHDENYNVNCIILQSVFFLHLLCIGGGNYAHVIYLVIAILSVFICYLKANN